MTAISLALLTRRARSRRAARGLIRDLSLIRDGRPGAIALGVGRNLRKREAPVSSGSVGSLVLRRAGRHKSA
jgi:hypothetical protein